MQAEAAVAWVSAIADEFEPGCGSTVLVSVEREVRHAIAFSLLIGAAGCGGSGDEPPQPVEQLFNMGHGRRYPAAGRQLAGGWRPRCISTAGRWRCATSGRIELRISLGAEATLSSGGRPLALVSDDRALVEPGVSPSPRRRATVDRSAARRRRPVAAAMPVAAVRAGGLRRR